MENLVNTIRQRLGFGQTVEEIRDDLRKLHSDEDIFLAYVAAKILSEAV